MARKVRGSMLIGIVATTLIGIPMGITNLAAIKLLSTPPSIAPTMATYVESTAGIVGIVPPEATSPALVMVGVLMMGSVTKLDFEDFTEALTAF